jgi:hypothetical protein
LLDETAVGFVIDRSEKGALDAGSIRIGRRSGSRTTISRSFISSSSAAAKETKPIK